MKAITLACAELFNGPGTLNYESLADEIRCMVNYIGGIEFQGSDIV